MPFHNNLSGALPAFKRGYDRSLPLPLCIKVRFCGEDFAKQMYNRLLRLMKATANKCHTPLKVLQIITVVVRRQVTYRLLEILLLLRVLLMGLV